MLILGGLVFGLLIFIAAKPLEPQNEAKTVMLRLRSLTLTTYSLYVYDGQKQIEPISIMETRKNKDSGMKSLYAKVLEYNQKGYRVVSGSEGSRGGGTNMGPDDYHHLIVMTKD